jgi:predicted CXXCH cytochrome family protein
LKSEVHKGLGEEIVCTACHDAHMSDNSYLLK